MIDVVAMQKGIVKSINTLVGKDAIPERQLFTTPVVRARQQGSLGDFPLVIVDKLPMAQYGISSVSDKYYNELDQLVTETRYKVSFMIDVHGSPDDGVLGIAQEIRDTFFRTYGRSTLTENTGAGILGISAPSFFSNYLNTDYEEIARLVIDFSVTDVFVEVTDSTGSITSIIVDGELLDDPEDTNPLTTHSTAP